MPIQTTGQQFASLIRETLRIGTRTRRHRRINRTSKVTDDLHQEILETVEYAITNSRDFSEAEIALYRAAWGAVCSWEKHITSGRASAEQCRYLNALSPWQLAQLLGEMADDGVTNTGQGERWFQARRDADIAASRAKFPY